jgi:hypothetical protein
MLHHTIEERAKSNKEHSFNARLTPLSMRQPICPQLSAGDRPVFVEVPKGAGDHRIYFLNDFE